MYHNTDKQSAVRQSFVQKIISYPNLSRDEEYELIEKWQNDGDEEARNKVIEAHLKSIFLYTKKVPPNLFFDAVNAATIGLMKAIDKFDSSKGFRLATLSPWYIRSALQLEPSLKKAIVKVPDSPDQKKLRGNFITSLRKVAGDKLDYTELDLQAAAKDLNIPVETVKDYYMITSSGDMSLNSVVNGDSSGSTELIDLMTDEDVQNQEDLLVKADERNLLHQAWEAAGLKDREADILRARRLQGDKVTLEDLSKVYDVSRERIRQIEVSAFEKLQRAAEKLARSFEGAVQFSPANPANIVSKEACADSPVNNVSQKSVKSPVRTMG